MTVTRDELFEQVWSKPMSTLAREYGISDVGLAKICKKMEIPRPERGYWRQIEVGRKPKKAKLKTLTKKGVERVYIKPSGYRHTTPTNSIKDILFPETLVNPHTLTAKSLNSLNKAKTGERGILIPRHKVYLDIQVTKESIERACLIMDTLIKTLEENDYTVDIVKGNPAKTLVMVDGEKLEIGIDEKIRSVEIKPTEEQKKKSPYHWYTTRYDYLPTGELALRIRNASYLGVRQQWADGKVQRVEKCLGSFIATLECAAKAKKEARVQAEIRKREWEEEQRLYKIQRRINFMEEKRAEKITKDAAQWSKVKQIRAYIQELEKITDQGEDLKVWIEWAKSYADSIDPIRQPDHLVFNEDNYSYW